MSEKYRVQIKVRNYHLDGYGHVNNAQYLNILEEARTKFMDDVNCSLEQYLKEGIFFYISEIHIKFKKPALLGDLLEVFVWFPVVKRAQVRFQQEIRLAGTGELIASASVSCGCVKNDRVIAVPQDFLQVMQKYHIPDVK